MKEVRKRTNLLLSFMSNNEDFKKVPFYCKNTPRLLMPGKAPQVQRENQKT
jgi:hypothetical protein